MLYIPTNEKIILEWSVKKGVGNESEDFSRATVSLFLFSDENRWAVPCTADYAGVVRAEIPETLPEGVYSLDLVWIKNDKSINETRCVQRTRKPHVFAIDASASPHQTRALAPDLPVIPKPGQPVTLKMETVAAPYGYDGLGAYEIAVMRGEVKPGSISEKEWADLAAQMIQYVGPFLTRRGGFSNLPDPNKQIIPIGFTYLLQTDPNDMATQRPVWWNGSAWIDSITQEAIKREEADKMLTAKIEEEAFVRETRDKRLESYIGQNEKAILAESVTRETEAKKLQKEIADNYVVLDDKKIEAKEINKMVNSIEDNIILKVKALQQRVENIKPVVIEGGTVVNNADEEDITNVHNALRIKDRDTLHGMGYVILRRDEAYNQQFAYTDTIYEVRYDIDLQGGTLETPDNCVLKFEGGKIKNGTVVLNNTLVLPNGCILSNHITANVRGTHAKGQYLFDEILGLPKYYDGDKWIDATGGAVGLAKIGYASDRPDPLRQFIPVGFIFLEEQVAEEVINDKTIIVATGKHVPYMWTGEKWIETVTKKDLIPNSGSIEEIPTAPTYDIPDGFLYLAYVADSTQPKPMWYSKTYGKWIEGVTESGLPNVGFASERPDGALVNIPVGFMFLQKKAKIDAATGEAIFAGEYEPYWWTGTDWVDATGDSHLLRIGSAAERPDARYQQIPIGFIYLEEKYKWVNGEKVPTGDYAPWWFTGSTWVDAGGKEKTLLTGGEWYERPTDNVPDGYQYMLRTAVLEGTRTYPIWWSAGEVNWVDAQGNIVSFE